MRRDVPYPDKCGLRCQMAEMWALLRGKLRSLNGVNGDGDGNIRLIAGSNISITEDAGNSSIEISASDGRGIETVNGQSPDASGNLRIVGGSGIEIGTTSNGVTVDADTEVLATQQQIGEIMSGDAVVGLARNAGYADEAGSQTSADSADTADYADEAGTAVALENARTIRTDLQSGTAASFDGTADVTPGVTGVLPIQNGGTGSSSKNFVDLSSDQNIGGIKKFTLQINVDRGTQNNVATVLLHTTNPNADPTVTSTTRAIMQMNRQRYNDQTDLGQFSYHHYNGKYTAVVRLRNGDGTYTDHVIQSGS